MCKLQQLLVSALSKQSSDHSPQHFKTSWGIKQLSWVMYAAYCTESGVIAGFVLVTLAHYKPASDAQHSGLFSPLLQHDSEDSLCECLMDTWAIQFNYILFYTAVHPLIISV